MKVLNIIGADLSKKSIDFALYQGAHFKVKNNISGFNELLKWKHKKTVNFSETMIVMEHTGLYSYRLEKFLHKKGIAFTKVSALGIKRSMGLVRGKNDKLDAVRIARYGFEKRDSLVPDEPVTKPLELLQRLYSIRERLVKNRAALKTAVKEFQYNCGLKNNDLAIESQLQLIKSFDRQIARLDHEIESIINTEKDLKTNHRLLVSIKGVGKVVALATIVKTRNFSRFAKPKKFACHCGTAPFENSSGTSIRSKTKVSHLADKKMKTLLDMAAKTAIQHDPELREYYSKRTMAGKSKMSTINIVRNKIINRMFAVIKRQTPFIENYLQSA